MIFKLGFRNVFRHKIRTFLTGIVIFMGLFTAIVGNGLNNGMAYQVIKNARQHDISDITIYNSNYYEDKDDEQPIQYYIKDLNKLENTIENINNKNSEIKYTEQINFNGKITDSINEIPANVYGIIPEKENLIFNRKDYIIQGKFFEKEEKNQAVLGFKLAEDLNLSIDSIFTLIARDSNSSINADDFKVTGIIRTENPYIDMNVLFINKDDAKTFTDIKEVNRLVLKIDSLNPEYNINIKDKLSKNMKNSNLSIISWQKEMEDIMKFVKIKKISTDIIAYIMLFMAFIINSNTLIMAVYERKREIGIMYACGMSRLKIIFLFIYESVITGALSGLCAIFLGGTLNYYLSVHGIKIPYNDQMMSDGMPLGSYIYSHFDINSSLFYFFISLLICAFAAFYPAYIATKLKPAEIIRN